MPSARDRQLGSIGDYPEHKRRPPDADRIAWLEPGFAIPAERLAIARRRSMAAMIEQEKVAVAHRQPARASFPHGEVNEGQIGALGQASDRQRGRGAERERDPLARETDGRAHGRGKRCVLGRHAHNLERAELPLSAWTAHVLERYARREALPVGRSWIVRHRGGRLMADTPPADVAGIVGELAEGTDVAVVVLHHWMFWDSSTAHPVLVALARALAGRRAVRIGDAARHLDDQRRSRRPLQARFGAGAST